MNEKELDILLHHIDEMIETSEPRRAEYYRGFRRGILFYIRGTLEETEHDHLRILDAADWSRGDRYLEAYAQGYRDGCRGLISADTF